MSVAAITPPELAGSASSMSTAPSRSTNSPDNPLPCTAIKDRVERRRNGRPGDSPTEILRRLPAAVALERLPVPSLAMARDGVILFANTAFADMVGYEHDAVSGLAFEETFQTLPAALCALSGVEAVANLVVQLRHREGWAVRARISKSALMRHDDPFILVTFENLTERLWAEC